MIKVKRKLTYFFVRNTKSLPAGFPDGYFNVQNAKIFVDFFIARFSTYFYNKRKFSFLFSGNFLLLQDDEDGEEDEEEGNGVDDAEEELPGMSLKSTPNTRIVSVVDPKERKQINKAAIKELQSSKAFKAKERIRAKKQSTVARFSRGKKLKKKRDRVHNPKKIVAQLINFLSFICFLNLAIMYIVQGIIWVSRKLMENITGINGEYNWYKWRI